MVRPKSVDEVRRDALRAAVAKAAAGCEPCAEAYLRVAIGKGARLAEVAEAARGLDPAAGIGRRDLLRLAGAALAVAGATAAGLVPMEALAATVYWGTDTNTPAAGHGFPQQYYLGHLGGETTPSCANFNVAAARAAGNDHTYMYWDLGGSRGRTLAQAYAYGRAQARAAIAAWHSGCNSQYVSGLTVFADLESGNPGWSGSSQAGNRRLVDGWLDYFHDYNPGPRGTKLRAGLYVSPGFWNQQLGSSFRASHPFVLWIWGCQTCSQTRAQVPAEMARIQRNVLGGSHAVIWQWQIGGCGGGDYDATTQNPFNFHPVPSASTYVCTGCGAGSPCP